MYYFSNFNRAGAPKDFSDSLLLRNRVAVVFINPAPKLGLHQNLRVELRGFLHLLPALLDAHEACAHPSNGLDRYHVVVLVVAQVPPAGDVQEAYLPVGLIDKEVSDVADPVVVEVGDGTMDEVARQKEDVWPLARCFHVRPPLYSGLHNY